MGTDTCAAWEQRPSQPSVLGVPVSWGGALILWADPSPLQVRGCTDQSLTSNAARAGSDAARVLSTTLS